MIGAEHLDLAKLKTEHLTTELTNELKVTTQRVDDLVLVFIENGYNKRIQGKVSADLTNMSSSNQLPYDFSVPPNTKMFAFSLTPTDHAKAHSYKLSASFNK
jgi:hypothetical protein